MFLNETLLVLAYTANMMATLPEKNVSVQNISTTTLSPEEKENKFDLDDRKCCNLLDLLTLFILQ